MKKLHNLNSRLGSPDAINWLSVVSVMVFQTCASLITSGVNYYPELVLFLSVRLGSLLVFVGVLICGHWLLTKSSRPQPMITIASFLLGISASTAVFDWLLVATGLAEESFLARRIVLSVVGATVILIMVALIVTTAREYAATNRDLEDTIVRVEALGRGTSERIQKRRDDLVSQVRELITNQLDHIELAREQSKEVMQSLIDDVIRPLSHSLARETPAGPEPSPSRGGPIPWRGVIRGTLTGNPFSPWAFSTAIGLIVATFLVLSFGLLGAVVTVGVFLVASVMNMALGVLWRLVPPSTPLWIRFVGVNLAVAPFLVFTVSFINWSTGFDLASSPVRLSAWVILVVGTWWVAVLATNVFSQLKTTNRQLDTTLIYLKTELAAVNGLEHQLRTRFARVLHGPIQQAVASALRSITTSNGAVVLPDVISQTKRRISDALTDLDLDKPVPLDISRELEEVREVWEGSVTIEADVSDSARELLTIHHETAHTVLELVREACQNAITHGDAQAITIVIDNDDTGEEVHINVHNDGAQPPPTPEPGMGSALFDALTVSWSRTSTPEGVAVSGIVPLIKP